MNTTDKSETELILINISGQDRPGVTSALTEILGKYDPDYDVIQATVGRGRKIGSYHIMDTNNPVMIFTATV